MAGSAQARARGRVFLHLVMISYAQGVVSAPRPGPARCLAIRERAADREVAPNQADLSTLDRCGRYPMLEPAGRPDDDMKPGADFFAVPKRHRGMEKSTRHRALEVAAVMPAPATLLKIIELEPVSKPNQEELLYHRAILPSRRCSLVGVGSSLQDQAKTSGCIEKKV